MIVLNTKTKTAALAHIHMATDLESVTSLFKALRKDETEQLAIYLAGVIKYTEDVCKMRRKEAGADLSEVVYLIEGTKNVLIAHADLRSGNGKDRSLAIDTRTGELFAVTPGLGIKDNFHNLSLSKLEPQERKKINDIITKGAHLMVDDSTTPLYLGFDGRSQTNGQGNFRGGTPSDIPSSITAVQVDSVSEAVTSCSL